MSNSVFLRSCPFCGKERDVAEIGTLYKSGIYWREDANIKALRLYVSHKERQESDKPCYNIYCDKSMFGCGAGIMADTEAEVIEKWNSRA